MLNVDLKSTFPFKFNERTLFWKLFSYIQIAIENARIAYSFRIWRLLTLIKTIFFAQKRFLELDILKEGRRGIVQFQDTLDIFLVQATFIDVRGGG